MDNAKNMQIFSDKFPNMERAMLGGQAGLIRCTESEKQM
jgi:hypothetical protein